MNKPKHTPGNWTTYVYANTIQVCRPKPLPGTIAIVPDCPEQEANARLIAAAPECLVALEHVSEYITRCNQGAETLNSADLTRILVSVITPAITKATGGTK